MSIGGRIQELRKRHGMTQEQLAIQIGATRQAVSKWEAGKSYPDIDYAVKIGDCFNVSMDYLLTGEEHASTQSIAHPDKQKNDKWKYICFGILIISGLALLLLLPLFVDLYHNYRISTYQSFHKTLINYYFEWPMKGVVMLSAGLTLTGLGGILWLYRMQIINWIHAE